ncbi:arylsulfatase B precursor, putative [Pediculus humanus corporis]|uniref:Arylsulfatase B, putative n=1 Tax=Pediculus humanus subsp. corporis TaxID=121224 RepID=E0W189_PEDHC|nr:arylsulfatase B precursor, putative [Pediculus humanus corporis]EEB19395.1 arylsulfatase B precursor, putative [Pediculus humanus corporis]
MFTIIIIIIGYYLTLCTWIDIINCEKLVNNPHIIIILADDLGWNDVGFHGSNQIPTPNIDALAFTGIILNNYYVAPVCTPSRSALLTGKYPIHTGLQHGVIHGSAPYGLNLNEKLLPEYLRSLNYVTRHVGKWHLGSFKKDYTPEYRGFDSHYGYWTGHQDYYDHTAIENPGFWGYDMRRGMNVTRSDFGYYTTDLFTNEAVKVIKGHDSNKPLFLYLAHLATHSGNKYSPLQAPAETVAKFNYIKDKNRRLFAGMLSKLDESVGKVVEALADSNMINNCVILFSTDNGGPAGGFNLNAASNWPLRGVKDTLWEGGVRGVGFIWSPFLPSSKVSNAMIHITDWLPTLLSLTNASNSISDIDGINVWPNLSKGLPSVRKEILLNIDTERKIAALRYKNWKYKKGNANNWNKWYGPSGRDMNYDWNELYNSDAAKAIKHIKVLPNKKLVMELINATQVTCNVKEEEEEEDESDQNSCERVIWHQISKMVPPRNKPVDIRSNPVYWDYTWTNWMDYL